MENLIPFTVFGSAIGFGIMIAIYLIVLFISDWEESGTFATVITGVLVGVIYFWGDTAFFEIFNWKNIAMYLLVGKVFALVRTYFKGKELDAFQKKSFNLRDNYLRWWFLFPFSAINWILGRLLKDFGTFIYSKMSGVIEKIFNA